MSVLQARFDLVSEELARRIEQDISPRTDLAIQTALAKAVAIGFNAGVADAIFEVETRAKEKGGHVRFNATYTCGADRFAAEYNDEPDIRV